MRYDPEAVAVAFERLFRTYRFVEPSEADEMLRVYFEALTDYETQDIEQGIRNMLSGKVEGFNASFLPPAPLVATAVRAAMNVRLDHEHRSRPPALPPPELPEPSADQKARVKALMEKAARNLAADSDEAELKARRLAQLRRTNEYFDNRTAAVETFNSADDDDFDMGGERVA